MRFNKNSQLTPRQHLIKVFLLGALGLSFSAASTSQETIENSNDTDEDRWYQIEVIIFARTYVPPSHQETWDKTVALAYPPHWVELGDLDVPISLDSDSTSPLNSAIPNISNLYDNSNQFGDFMGMQAAAPYTSIDTQNGAQEGIELEKPAESVEPNPKAEPLTAAPDNELDQTNSANDNTLDAAIAPGTNTDTEIQPTTRMPNPAQDPFYKLPHEIFELTPLEQDLRRKNGYRVLFHEAWRQPVQAEENAKSVLINGGKTYGEHTELEGSLKISVSRYLHVHTNLWLAEFIPNFGQNIENWPQLPEKPQINLRQNTPAGSMNLAPAAAGQQELVLINEYSKIIDQPYVIDQLYTLKQRRRMRSEELHYIDHPVLGLIIKVIPFDYQEPSNEDLDKEDDTTGEITTDESQ